MDISTDFRRKMIIKLLEALKESPSFCNISDSQLKEAVLNSEHQTFQQSKNKDEYFYHINEKLKKIKQSSLQRYETQGMERANVSCDDRSKIINGNVPPYVKISQGYSQDNPQQPGNAQRKIETFSTGTEMQYTGEIDTKASYMNACDTSMGAKSSADPKQQMQTFSTSQGYVQNPVRYQEFSPSTNEFDLSKRNNFHNIQKRRQGYVDQDSYRLQGHIPEYNNVPPKGHIQEYNVPPKGHIQEYNNVPPQGHIPEYNVPNEMNLYNRHQPIYSDVRNMKPKPTEIDPSRQHEMNGFHNPDIKQPMGFNESNSEHKNTAQMFSSPGGKFKTDMYSDKFNNSQFMKRVDPSLTSSEHDPRRMPFEYQAYNQKRAVQQPTLSQALKNQGQSFEYTYNPSNRSYIGNVNPGLLDQAQKMKSEPDFFNVATRPKTNQPEKNLFTMPFDEKKSERLFRSFSEEFMKNKGQSSTSANNLKREVFEPKSADLNSEIPVYKDSNPQISAYKDSNSEMTVQNQASTSTNDSFESLDDEIPDELQLFLSQNNLSLKEIENEEEWSQLFKNVYSKYKDLAKNSSDIPFSNVIEMQKKFLFFPFIDENDLKEFMRKMDSEKQKTECILKMNKDDYLEFIDRAIEAFSEKKIEKSGFCADAINSEKKYE